MATTPNTLSPLPSRTDGLGIFPSGDSLSRNSVYSYGHTRSSTCTVLSYAQQFDQEKTPSPASLTRTTTIRANLKEIQKSPLPHRFNLIPSSRRRVPEQPSKIPRSTTAQWPQKSGQRDVESGYTTRSPSLYATSPEPQSPQFEEQRNEDKRTILEDLLSDALDSPVFDCIPTFSPPCTPSPRTQMVSPPSFTLVQDQTSHKSRQSSITPDSIRELQASVHSRHGSMDRLPAAFPPPLPSPPVATPRNKAHLYEDSAQASPTTPQDVFDTHPEDTPQSIISRRRSSTKHPERWQTTPSASSSKDFFTSGGLDTSGSAYSQTSLHRSFGAGIGHENQLQAASRRATHGSFASLVSSDSRRRKFAVRRQAIYAEYGFKLAFPESDSSSSVRHTHIPTSSSRDFGEAGPSSRATSAYVDSRSEWSASTSAVSIRSQLQQEEDPAEDDDDGDDPRGSEHLPYPSTRSLASLSSVEPFSVQDVFLSSSLNPLLDDYADLMTSTPPAKPRSQDQHPAALNLKQVPQLDSLPETPRTKPGGRRRTLTGAHVYACGLEWQPWPPLRLWSTDPENGNAIVRRSSSTLERAQMFAKWQDDPGHHPIVQELLDAVDVEIREWNHGLPVITEYV